MIRGHFEHLKFTNLCHSQCNIVQLVHNRIQVDFIVPFEEAMIEWIHFQMRRTVNANCFDGRIELEKRIDCSRIGFQFVTRGLELELFRVCYALETTLQVLIVRLDRRECFAVVDSPQQLVHFDDSVDCAQFDMMDEEMTETLVSFILIAS